MGVIDELYERISKKLEDWPITWNEEVKKDLEEELHL
jgi:hypothetical protein